MLFVRQESWRSGARAEDPLRPRKDERQTVSTLYMEKEDKMRRALGVAAVVAVLWIGTANFVQGFS